MKRDGLMQPQVVLLIWSVSGPESGTIFGFVCPCSPHAAFAAAANINNPVKRSDAQILPNKTAPNIQGDEKALR